MRSLTVAAFKSASKAVSWRGAAKARRMNDYHRKENQSGGRARKINPRSQTINRGVLSFLHLTISGHQTKTDSVWLETH
jgi:hypothetical protein